MPPATTKQKLVSSLFVKLLCALEIFSTYAAFCVIFETFYVHKQRRQYEEGVN